MRSEKFCDSVVDESVTTKAVIKSLEIFARASSGLTPRQFAQDYFDEDHPGWQRVGKAGYGVTRGQGLILWSGGWFGRLRKQGLIRRTAAFDELNYHGLTDKGWSMLKAIRETHRKES
jgi:hypothetical protein